MNKMIPMQLKTTCISSVPVHAFEKDFVFVVNGEEFKTSRIIADLLSPKICQMHATDAAADRYTINTQNQGDFSHILSLVNFQQNQYPEKDYPFISEVIKALGNESIKNDILDENIEITAENVFSRLRIHENNHLLHSNNLAREIEFISGHFFEMCQKYESDFLSLSLSTLSSIVSSANLKITDEDQLLNFVNKIYSEDSKYVILYEYVMFDNVSNEKMSEFLSVFDVCDITTATWRRMVDEKEREFRASGRYVERLKAFTPQNGGKNFNGIINFLRAKSEDHITSEISITSSSVEDEEDVDYQPINVTMYEDKTKIFSTKSEKESWIMFDFNERRVEPTDYTIRSMPVDANYGHPRSWVIEVSNDLKTWDVVDEQENTAILNGISLVHTFAMNRRKEGRFRYVRMKLTGENWFGDYGLVINAFEIYGKLIL